MGRYLCLALFVLFAATSGCKGRSHGAVDSDTTADLTPEFSDVTFAELYPIFLRHKVARGPKAALWAQRYSGRWVRWTGRIRSFTANGVTLRELPTTTTFDVSLRINHDQQAATRARYNIGDVVRYVGRLDSYDDIWRTLYLVNGSILGLTPMQDAGF